MAGRIVAILVTVISVPLTVRYLGSERYGAWVTICSVLTFLNITDFGLGPSLANSIGRSQADDERSTGQRYVSSALFALFLVAGVILILGNALAGQIASFLFPTVGPAVRAEIASSVMVALSIFALNLPLLVNTRVLAAHQENAIANFWNMIGSLGNLVALLAVIWFRGGLPWLVLGCFGFSLLVNAGCAIWLFGFHKPWLRPRPRDVDLGVVKHLFSDGWKFFVISIGWMINWQTDNVVIAHYLGPAHVTPYAVAFSMFALASGLQTLAYQSLWPAYTEAYAQRDYEWIRQAVRSNLKFSFVSSLAVSAVLILFGSDIIRAWAGAVAVPPILLLVWMAAWRLMFSTMLVGTCLLNATGHLKGMTVYGSVTALLNLTLSILLVQKFGITGVIAATTIAYAVASYIPTFVEARGVLRRMTA